MMNVDYNCLVIGLGNPLLSDDAIGLDVVTVLKEDKDLKQFSCFEFKHNYSGGLDLLEDICGYKKVFIIDCFEIESDEYPCGKCIELNLEDLSKLNFNHFLNTHGLTLPMLMDLGSQLDLKIPDELKIIGVVGFNCREFSEKLSGPLLAEKHLIIQTIKKSLMEWGLAIHGRFNGYIC